MKFARENKLTSWHIGIALAALFIGGSFGPLQKMEHVGINWYPALSNVGIQSYYQGLSLHGVLNALSGRPFLSLAFLSLRFRAASTGNCATPGSIQPP